jgi:glycosyltransferase involved in cell wall biosynthesis
LADNRLLEALAQFGAEEAEQIFKDEYAGPDGSIEPAPVKRVAIFAEAFLPKVDGVSKTAYLTLQHLQQTGREVLVFAPDTAPTFVGNSRVVPLPSVSAPAAPETRIALPTPSISSILDDFKPDLVHLFSPALLSAGGMIYARRRGLPVIANYQTDLPTYAYHYGWSMLAQPARDWLRAVHNGCHLTLVPSDYTLGQLQSWGYHRLRRWARGVNGDRFNPNRRSAAWRARLLNGRDPHSLLCLYVGRLANEKRVDLLLEVAQTPGVALTIIGDGALRGELEALFEGTGTHFMGYRYGEDLADAYASADVFLFPGPCETFGQVVQEALASGLPAVVINQGGVAELVDEGFTGFRCPPDPAAFATAARRLRDNPPLRARMSAAARLAADARPWSAIMAQLENYYREAVALNRRFNQFVKPPTSPFQPFTTLFQRGR